MVDKAISEIESLKPILKRHQPNGFTLEWRNRQAEFLYGLESKSSYGQSEGLEESRTPYFDRFQEWLFSAPNLYLMIPSLWRWPDWWLVSLFSPKGRL